jgi:hypothetical protein
MHRFLEILMVVDLQLPYNSSFLLPITSIQRPLRLVRISMSGSYVVTAVAAANAGSSFCIIPSICSLRLGGNKPNAAILNPADGFLTADAVTATPLDGDDTDGEVAPLDDDGVGGDDADVDGTGRGIGTDTDAIVCYYALTSV